MTLDPSSHAEVTSVARALEAERPLAATLGVPSESLAALRAFARWASETHAHELARLAWTSAIELDGGLDAWLGLAQSLLASRDRDGAWHAARAVLHHPSASPADRASAALVIARVELGAGQIDRAREHLAQVNASACERERRLAEAILRHLDGRDRG